MSLWWRGSKAPSGAIEGYASWPSVEPGGRLELHVSTNPASRYRVTVHRLGWYAGSGGRTVAVHPQTGDAQGVPQPVPLIGPGPEVVSCGWPVTDSIPVGRDWVSGQYVAKLTLTEGGLRDSVAFVPFVVRAPLGAPCRRPRPDAGDHRPGLQQLGRQEPVPVEQQRWDPGRQGQLRPAEPQLARREPKRPLAVHLGHPTAALPRARGLRRLVHDRPRHRTGNRGGCRGIRW